ncbi:LOW QUALITY PROTEIN: Hypothetical protein PHPALM_17677 [Phytophthora palmivora]|uniref:Peptidase A2 domain-containing protein n=1 Tax=Phytophthora palmivora TaxID=4796 RepID=A0A2P4XLT9_9STRA|nr:LOW QUALITY PROTEIN: Hypothetical protein PHPALM_17677 [Phytophthora palmivora]
MMRDSEWMKLFAPVPLAQARWPSLGPLLAGPMEWSDTAEVAETTILLLKAMGFRVTSRSSPWILSVWNLDLTSVELLRWKGKLRNAFGMQIKPRLLMASDGGYQLGGMESQPGEMPSPKGGQLATNPSKITTMKTPETKKGERFRATAGTPYFEDSHMLSPKKSRTRLGRNKWESEEDNLAEAENDSDDDHGYRPVEMKRSKTTRYTTSATTGGGSQYLELRSHVSLDKIAQFGGRYRSDDSLQWLKRHTYAPRLVVRTVSPQLRPDSKKLVSATPKENPDKMESAERGVSGLLLFTVRPIGQDATICDFLTRLNGYAQTAKIQYERGGADAADHVEQFLPNCGDDDIMDMLYPLQLNDIHRVEQFINKKILGEKRKKQRDRLEEAERNCAEMIDETTRRREDKHDARRDAKREIRRDDRRSDRRQEESRDRWINTADYVVEELYGSTGHTEAGRGQLSRDTELYDSEESDGYSAHGQDEDAESEDDTDYVAKWFCEIARSQGSSSTLRPNSRLTEGIEVGKLLIRFTTITSMLRSPETEATRLGPRGTRLDHLGDRLKDEIVGTPRWNASSMSLAPLAEAWATRFTFVGDVFCKQVHEIGQCELFRRYEKLASFVKNNVDKSKVPDPPTLTGLEFSGLPQSAEPVVEANFVFAFVGEAGWPEGSVGTDEGMCGSDGNERESEESDEDDSAMKFDRRVRIRALVMGAVIDRRVKILLDTGANVSAVSSTLHE